MSTILRVPITFPAETFNGTLLSAMSVPDLNGSQGTYYYYSSDPDERLTMTSGVRVGVEWQDGIARSTITGPEMTANLDTDLEHKFNVAKRELQRSDLVVLHLKGADIAAHDQRPDLKVSFLERVDQALAGLRAWIGPLRIAVASDHATLSESGQHAADPLPVLIWGEGVESDEVETYDEQAAGSGKLQRFPLQLLLSRLYKLS